MTDSSFSPADAKGLAAWFHRGRSQCSGTAAPVERFWCGPAASSPTQPENMKTADGTPMPEGVTDRIVANSTRADHC